MRVFALELNNDIKGIVDRKEYIEGLISKLPFPDLVLLPELAVCSYMASQAIWQYADEQGNNTAKWGTELARKYNTYLGIGYVDYEQGDYYNRYMIVGKDGVCGIVTKSEGESAVFKRGSFDSIIDTPFGKVAVAICYDAKRKHFYDNIKDQEISLIIFPHGCPADPKKPEAEIKTNATFCNAYADAYGVPVVYINSVGSLEYMPGKMGQMMEKAGFRMNGRTKIYGCEKNVEVPIKEAFGIDTQLAPRKRKKEIHFYGKDLIKGNYLFRKLILEPDVRRGILAYKATCSREKLKSI